MTCVQDLLDSSLYFVATSLNATWPPVISCITCHTTELYLRQVRTRRNATDFALRLAVSYALPHLRVSVELTV